MARAAIVKHLPEVGRAIRQTAAPSIGTYDDDDDGDVRSDYYDRLYQWFRDNPEDVVKPICTEVSRILTQVLRDIAIKRQIGNPIIQNYFEVQVEAREYSDDTYKHYGGYHSAANQKVKVFIKGNLAADAAMGIIQEDLFGEEVENYKGKFIDLIVPIFCHEYTHFEQFARRTFDSYNDLGYITLGVKRSSAGRQVGKRGGLRRDTKSAESYLRYMSSLKEIDAWASGAAAELVQTITRTYSRPEASNEQIQELRQSIALGWSDSESYENYRRHYYHAIEGNYPGLKQAEMTKVWHRFLKMLYSKLGDYLAPTVGKAPPYLSARLDPHWVKYAEKMPTAAMIAFLARVVGMKLLSDDTNPERVMTAIDRGFGGIPQDKGEDFIRAYYFGDDWYNHEDRLNRYIAVFRRLMKKNIMAFAADDDMNFFLNK